MVGDALQMCVIDWEGVIPAACMRECTSNVWGYCQERCQKYNDLVGRQYECFKPKRKHMKRVKEIYKKLGEPGGVEGASCSGANRRDRTERRLHLSKHKHWLARPLPAQRIVGHCDRACCFQV